MRALIVEDEEQAARRAARLLDSLAPGSYSVCVRSVEEARAALSGGGFDLVLLDLDLGGADGFDALPAPGDGPAVIVVSGRTERAIDAFDRAVVDFVAKPVDEARLKRALDRAAALRAPAGFSLAARAGGRLELARAEDIVSLHGADDYVEIALADGRRLLHDMTLDALERRLPAQFLRVHRSHIVNLSAARALEGASGRRLLRLSDGRAVPVSRRRETFLRSALKG